MKIKSCGVIPFIKEDNEVKFLLIKHLDGHWSFPKGKKDPGESDLETAKREFLEETGINEIQILDHRTFIEKYSFTKDEKEIEKEVVYYLGEVQTKDVKIQQEEVSEYKWLDYDNALKVLTHKETIQILTDANEYMN